MGGTAGRGITFNARYRHHAAPNHFPTGEALGLGSRRRTASDSCGGGVGRIRFT